MFSLFILGIEPGMEMSFFHQILCMQMNSFFPEVFISLLYFSEIDSSPWASKINEFLLLGKCMKTYSVLAVGNNICPLNRQTRLLVAKSMLRTQDKTPRRAMHNLK